VVAGGGRNEKGEGEKRIRLCKQGHRGMGHVLMWMAVGHVFCPEPSDAS
jgi:hypothetical protein